MNLQERIRRIADTVKLNQKEFVDKFWMADHECEKTPDLISFYMGAERSLIMVDAKPSPISSTVSTIAVIKWSESKQ